MARRQRWRHLRRWGSAAARLAALTGRGFRVLAVAAGPPAEMVPIGLIGLSDPPRPDSRALLAELRALGVHTVMVTGDAAATAANVAAAIGLDGPTCPAGAIPDSVGPRDFAVYAGVFPEDKFRLVKAFQRQGHTVAMCGDGANDAPALRQAQMGIAVASATDVAKSAAGMVLTAPGLGAIVAAIKEGRSAYQRILTYTLNALVKKFELVLFLGAGLLLTGRAVLPPLLMALLLITGDFITMSLTTDRAVPSPTPDAWRIGKITAAAAVFGLFGLAFAVATLWVARHSFGFALRELQSLAFITLVFVGQATIYVVRERKRMWRSRPGTWLILSSVLDIGIACTLAATGTLMAPLALSTLAVIAAGAAGFAVALDIVKAAILPRLGIA